MPVLTHVWSWLRQTTTVQGLAVLALTAVLQITTAVPWGVVVSGAAASLVLLILPGQGDLSRKIGALGVDLAMVAATRGSPATVGKLATDGLELVKPGLPGGVTAIGDAPIANKLGGGK